MTTTSMALALDEAMAGADVINGHGMVELGEDGESWLIAGHVDQDEALAIINIYLDECGCDLLEPDYARVEQTWCAFRPHRDDCPTGQPCDDDCDPEDCDHKGGCYCDECQWWPDFSTTIALAEHPDPVYHPVTHITA